MNRNASRLRFKAGKQRELLLRFKEKYGLKSTEMANLLGISRRTLVDWVRGKFLLPAAVYVSLCEIEPMLCSFQSQIAKELPSAWGQKKGGKKRIHQIRDVNAYCAAIRSQKDLKRALWRSTSNYAPIPKNEILKQLLKDGANPFAVLATCLLTDGSLLKSGSALSRIAFSTNDETLRDFMYALLLKLSQFRPSVHLSRKNNYSVRVTDKELSAKLLSLSPNYITSPKKPHLKELYFFNLQPTASFILEETEATRNWCIRFALTTDGSISFSRSNDYELGLACYHPTLAKEWQRVLATAGIKSTIAKTRNSWCGISGTRTYDLASIRRFADLGGFIPGVKISKKSKRFEGMEKNALLQQIVNARGRI